MAKQNEEQPGAGLELTRAPLALHPVTMQLLAEQEVRLAEEAAAVAAARALMDPRRPAWRNNPIFTPEWGDQLRRHLGLMDWPEIEIAGTIEGGSEQAWQSYFEQLQKGGYNTPARQVTERRIRYHEACLWAEQDGEPRPADPDVQPESHMYASPELLEGLGDE